MTEVPIAVEFDPEKLSTVGIREHEDDSGGNVTTAHPHRVPGSDDLVNYVLRFSRRSEYRVFRRRSGEWRRELLGSVPTDRPGYLHSFGTTENHVVRAEFPFVVNPLSLLLSGKPFIANYRWRPGRGARFTVLGLNDGEVRGIYAVEPFFGLSVAPSVIGPEYFDDEVYDGEDDEPFESSNAEEPSPQQPVARANRTLAKLCCTRRRRHTEPTKPSSPSPEWGLARG